MPKRKQLLIRHGRNKDEVLRRWQWNYPNTVVDNITYNGKTESGEREYFIFYHDRKRPSKKSKDIQRLKARGVEYGRSTLRGRQR